MSTKVAVYEAVKAGHATRGEVAAVVNVKPTTATEALRYLAHTGSLRLVRPGHRDPVNGRYVPALYEVNDG